MKPLTSIRKFVIEFEYDFHAILERYLMCLPNVNVLELRILYCQAEKELNMFKVLKICSSLNNLEHLKITNYNGKWKISSFVDGLLETFTIFKRKFLNINLTMVLNIDS